MKIKNLFIALVALTLVFTSCNNDDEETAKPVINNFEMGSGDDHGDDHSAHVGGDIHIEAEILADGKIDYIEVEIHAEEHKSLTDEGPGWAFDSTYTIGYEGKLNAEFHEHIEIDTTASVGHYHFHLSVTDMEGNETSVEEELELLAKDDEDHDHDHDDEHDHDHDHE